MLWHSWFPSEPEGVCIHIRAIQMNTLSLFSKWITKTDPSFQKSFLIFFFERKNFIYYFIILFIGLCQSFEWICKTGSHKQRSISCPSTWGQPSHLGEWLQSYMLFAVLQKWSDLNFGLDQQNYPFCGLCAGRWIMTPRPSFLPLLWKNGKIMGLTHWAYFFQPLVLLDCSFHPEKRWIWALGSTTCLTGDPVTGVKLGPPGTDKLGELLVVSQN